MTESEKKRRIRLVGILLVLYVGMWWWGNPIRLHQKVQVAGVMVPVPFGWVATPSRAGGIEGYNLRHAYNPFQPTRPWVTASVSRGISGESFTMELARRLQQNQFAFDSRDSAHDSNPRIFDLSAGKYRSLCAEETLRGSAGNPSAQHVLCFVVGTPVMASFSGPKDVDGDAARILASLE